MECSMSNLLLGIDCGLTNVKAVVFDEHGKMVQGAERSTPIAAERIDADALWKSVAICIKEAVIDLEIAAVCVTGHGNGLYALDKDCNVIIALPPMGQNEEVFIREPKVYYGIVRQSAWAGQPLQLLRKVTNEDETLYSQIAHILHCKDYIRYRLTGRLATDFSDASASALIDANTGKYEELILELCGLRPKEGLLPPILKGREIAGSVTHEVARFTGLREGTPVATGLIDLDACRIGAGVTESDCLSVTAGTWGISVSPQISVIDSSSITQNCFSYDDKHRIAVVSAPVSCVNLDWFIRNFMHGISYAEAERIAGCYEPDEISVLYLPYLYSDMARPQVKASFVGMTPETTLSQMLRGVYEGVLLAHIDQIKRLQKAGINVSEIRLSGGAARSPLWRQLFADGFGLPVQTLREKQVGALGSAIMAATAVGLYPNVQTAVERMVQLDTMTKPLNAMAYDTKYNKFIELAGEV